MTALTKIDDLLEANKSLFWDIVDTSKLNRLSILERFFQYGNWDDIQALIMIYGKEALRRDYITIRSKHRMPLSRKTLHFFDLYFYV